MAVNDRRDSERWLDCRQIRSRPIFSSQSVIRLSEIKPRAGGNASVRHHLESIAALIIRKESFMTNPDQKQVQKNDQQNQGGRGDGQQGGQNQKPDQQNQGDKPTQPGQQGGNATPQPQK
jgi:hypothetical protein